MLVLRKEIEHRSQPEPVNEFDNGMQLPSVLTAKSGQEQKLSPQLTPRIATLYSRFVCGLKTVNSKNTGSPPIFLSLKFCFPPNSFRSAICHCWRFISSGFCKCEIFAVFPAFFPFAVSLFSSCPYPLVNVLNLNYAPSIL
jgi:hypothetical protein